MAMPAWDIFFERAVREVLVPGARVLDVGAGLRIDGARGNRVDPVRAWIRPLADAARYEVLDPVATYHPDIVADVQAMPQVPDAAYDAVFCLAVLEHVPRAWDAVREMRRVLKPGGRLVGHVPFLSPYHAMEGYYGDYVRLTSDGIRALCAEFASVDVVPVRGLAETLAHLVPGRQRALRAFARRIDALHPGSGKQTSGHYFVAIS